MSSGRVQPMSDGLAAKQSETEPGSAARIRSLETEVAGLRQALRTRGLIEQAKGRLAERLGIDPEEAFRRLATQSQESNVPVVDLAADIMAVRRPGAAGEVGAARREAKLRADIGSGATPVDLVTALAEPNWVGAEAVVIFAAQPGGALLLLAAQGWPASLVEDWQWVPSDVLTPAGEAIRRMEPVWLDDPGPFVLVGPGSSRAALPICADGAAIAAVEVALPPGRSLDPPTRQQLSAAAEALGHWFAAADLREGSPGFGDLSASTMLDAVVGPAALLTPLWTASDGGGGIEDFRIDRANSDAASAWRITDDVAGRRLLDVDPGALHDGRFDACVGAFEGRGSGGSSCRALRVGGRLFATWRAHDGDTASTVSRMAAMEELGSFGWGEWTDTGQPLTWSRGLFTIVGRPIDRTPLSLDRLIAAVESEDRAAAQAAIDGVLRHGDPVSVELRFRRPDASVRAVRLAIAARQAHDGRSRAVVALVQDRTEARLDAEVIADTAERFATQRLQAAFERAQSEQLRAAFLPPPRTQQRLGPLAVVARHVTPTRIQSFRGDFYEIGFDETDPAETRLLLAVGDVFGTGIGAAHTTVRLRHGARALAMAAVPVPRILGLLNRELCRDAEPPLASMALASIDRQSHTVTWAQAGHYSPILVRQGRARSLRRPRGDVLGLLESTQYGRSAVQLRPGDLLVIFTDGVFQRWDPGAPVIRRLAAECQDAQRHGGAEALLDTLLPPAEDDACIVAVEWPDR